MVNAAETGSESPSLNLNILTPPGAQYEPGGFWRRFVAVMLDGIITSVVTTPVGFILPVVFQAVLGDVGAALAIGFSWIFSMVIVFFYFGWFYQNKGATPGKMVMGLKVLDAEKGTHIGYARAFFRETVGKMVSSVVLLIGYLMAAFRSDKKSLHDLMFTTQVVHIKK